MTPCTCSLSCPTKTKPIGPTQVKGCFVHSLHPALGTDLEHTHNLESGQGPGLKQTGVVYKSSTSLYEGVEIKKSNFQQEKTPNQ